MAFTATWMDPEMIILSEASQSQYHVMLRTYGILKKRNRLRDFFFQFKKVFIVSPSLKTNILPTILLYLEREYT